MGLDVTGVGAVASLIGKVLDVLGLDPQVKLEATQKMAELTQTGELARLAADTDLEKIMLQNDGAQINANNTEASNSNLFVSGWRPFIGWICGVGLAWHVFLASMVTFGDQVFGGHLVAPGVPWEDLKWTLGIMLGFGGLRTWEKFRGVAS